MHPTIPLRLHIENDPDAPAAMRVSEAQIRAKLEGRLDTGELDIVVNDDPAAMASRLGGATVLLACRTVDLSAARAASEALAWTQVVTAGVEKVLPTLPPGMMLTNASGVHGEKGAEFILAAALMLTFQIPQFVTDKEQKRWAPVYGGVLAGKTAMLLGVGGIGEAAAALLLAHGVRVIGVTRQGRSAPPLGETIAIADIDAMLPSTDFLVSTLPKTQETAGLIGRARLRLLPHGAGVVVVGRASVFDYAALVDALRDGHLGGAVLDVFPEEPLPPDSPLWTCPRLIMTPHCSLDDHVTYMERCLDIFADNLVRFRAGAPLRNVVDPVRGY